MRITAILTTYNSGSALDATLKSILGQEGAGEQFELEVIAVDDCSTDGTWEKLQEFPIKALQNAKNSGGPNVGRNVGLKEMTGQFFCIADHDDIWEPKRVLKLLPHLDKAPIITSGFTIEYTDRGTQSFRGAGVDQAFGEGVTFRQKLARIRTGQNTYLGAMMVSAELREILFEEDFGRIDFDWVLRVFEGRPSFEVGESLYRRIVDGANLSLDPIYREHDFQYSLQVFEGYAAAYGAEVRQGRARLYSSRGKYHYVMGEVKQARYYFLRGERSLRNLLYFLTTFIGRKWVVKRFTIFG